LNIHSVNDDRLAEIRTSETVSESISSKVEIGIGKLKRNISPGIDQIPAKLIGVGCT
jgi:hypothetical protein